VTEDKNLNSLSLLYYLIRKKNWFISDKNIDWFLFLICYYIHRESGNVEL